MAMRLFEYGLRPDQVGMVILVYERSVEPGELPRIEGKAITLPNSREGELFLLSGGNQFLYTHGDATFWFGGTDDGHPFLVEIAEQPFYDFLTEGEAAFFDMLKPDIITQMEEKFKTTARRSGRLFALELPMTWTWEEKVRMLEGCGIRADPRQENGEKVAGLSIPGTAYKLSGYYRWATDRESDDRFILAAGTLHHPQRPPLELHGLHFLVPAANIKGN
ncbi:MAG TPA: hypothetical protein VJC16_07905 [Candidatus Nanoarchaeia archaeon]|nr:hypothetical protein [Candidatus Nanoarchaeia archaeon]